MSKKLTPALVTARPDHPKSWHVLAAPVRTKRPEPTSTTGDSYGTSHMGTLHTYKVDKNTRVIVVFDDDYQSEGTFAFDTEEETRAAVEWEQSRIDASILTPYAAIKQERCECCGNWEQIESVWGCVYPSGDYEDVAKELI
jgi:hypothetical protein